MAFTERSEHGLDWYYALPVKKDRTLVYKLIQSYLIVMGVLLAITMIAGYSIPLWEKIKFFGIIGGFVTVVMVLCYPLTILIIKLLVLYMRGISRLVSTVRKKGDSQGDSSDKEKSSEKAGKSVHYHFKADEQRIHSWSVVETKGGKHIRYRSVRKLTRCKEENWIEIYGFLSRTTIYAEDDDFEIVWDFIASRCTRAKIN